MKLKPLMHKEKGIGAGLDVLLTVVVGIFLIGMLVFAFVITSSKMMEATTDPDAIKIINDTKLAIGDTSDFFPIFIIIGSVVALIFLIVLIVRQVNLSGMGGMGA